MKQENMTIVKQTEIVPTIYEMILTGNLVQYMTSPGQFLDIKVPQGDLILRRPFGICSVDQQQKTVTILYRLEGVGTQVLSQLSPGMKLDVLGPLGTGFPIDFIEEDDPVLIIGGGIGLPPLYELSKQLHKRSANIYHLFGFAKKEVVFYEKQFSQFGKVYTATDDGSYGIKGTVQPLIEQVLLNGVRPKAVYACGAKGLLQLVDTQFLNHPHAYISHESRMACGVGACYACVCHVKGDTTKTKSKKVCEDGPVFKTGEVIL